jgi:hypothetical protein
MEWFGAQDTFVATLASGAEELVTKGKPFPGTHELVARDQAASRDNPGRIPLFRKLDQGEEEPPPQTAKAAPAKAAPSRSARAGGA